MSTLQAVLEVSLAWAQERDPERLLQLIVQKATEVAGAERGCVALIEGEQLAPRAMMGFGDGESISLTAARQVLAHNVPMAWEDLLRDHEVGRARSVLAQRLRAVMCAPLMIAGKAIGVLYVDATAGANYTCSDLVIMQALANQAAVALENTRLYQEAITDSLTGLYSAGYFYRRLQEEVERALRYRRPVALILADLNGLKGINDRHGHLAGNHALKTLAAILRGQVRAVDVPCRYGGDEFAIILPESGLVEAEALRARLEEAVLAVSNQDLPGWKGASFGTAAYPEDGETGEELFAAADGQVYTNKKKA
jgi:diguanylate cyclase (GGDEF)-like protein